MERAEILTAMFELKLFGMKSAFDEIIATASVSMNPNASSVTC